MGSSNWSVWVALTLALVLTPAAAVRAQARPSRPQPPTSSVRLLKVGTVDGRSAPRQRPFGPNATAVVVEIRSPAAGIAMRFGRDSAAARVGDRVVPAAFVFIIDGDTGIVDAVATRDAVPWEIVIGTDTYQALGPVIRRVLDLRQRDYVEYRFTRSGVLRLAVVFEESPASLGTVTVAGHTLDVARSRLRLGGQWNGVFAWRGVTGRLRFAVDTNSSEVGDLGLGFTCANAARPGQASQPAPHDNVTLERPAWPVVIRQNNTFEFGYLPAAIGSGTGRFVTTDSAVGTFRGGELGCGARRPVPLRGAWSAKRTGSPVREMRYSFRSDTVLTFSIRDDRLVQPYCREAGERELELSPGTGGYLVRGDVEFTQGRSCIWQRGLVHKWIGEHTRVHEPILAIRSDSAAPLRFRVDRTAGYVYLDGRGTLTLEGNRVVQLPFEVRLVADEPQVATTRLTPNFY